MIYTRMLLLAKRSLPVILIILAFYLLVILIMRLFGARKYVVPTILFALILFFCLWVDCFSWHSLRPLTLIYESKTRFTAFRTENNQKTVPELYTWSPVYRNGNNGLIETVVNEYMENGGNFDFDHYTYIATFGFTMIDLYANDYFRDSDVCIAIHGYNCEPDQVLLYRIPQANVEPGSDRINEWFYIFTNRR